MHEGQAHSRTNGWDGGRTEVGREEVALTRPREHGGAKK